MLYRTAVPLLVAAAAALIATPAQAAPPTFTVTPGGAWSGTRAPDSTAGIRNAHSNQVTLCAGLTVAGSFKPGTSGSGTTIGSLTSIQFTDCRANGVPVTVTASPSAANPAPVTLTAVTPADANVATGQAGNISLTLDDANGCHAVIGARPAAGGGPGFTGIAYRTTDARLSFAAAGKGLYVQSTTAQCGSSAYHGLAVQPNDRIALGGFGNSILDSSVLIAPPQTITAH